MRVLKWIEWNLQKIDAHALSAEEVEAAFDRVFHLEDRKGGSYQMFAETQLPPLELPPDAVFDSVEAHLGRQARRAVAVPGIVENGMVRPLDPAVKLPEHARVIIVATDAS